MVKPIDLQIKTVKETSNEGVYTLDPLPRGYGHTIGNVLRRVLMTSVKGAAITQARIKGVDHQFSTIEGVKEDVVAITLNLKNLRFKKFNEGPVVLTLSANKKGLITIGDFECPSDVEVVNKKSPVATITKSGVKLEMVTDALFTPVLDVSYDVSSTRFDKSIDLDKVTLSIKTDGSVSPKEAIVEGSKLIKAFFERLIIWNVTEEITEEVLESVSDSVRLKNEAALIEELPLPTRTLNALKKAGVISMQELAGKTDEDLLDIKNLGQKSIEEIRKLLETESLR